MRKRLPGIPQIALPLIRDAELVERRVPRAVQLADRRRGLGGERVEVAGQDVDDRRRCGAGLVGQGVDVVGADGQLVLRRQVEVGADEDLLVGAALAELVGASRVVAICLGDRDDPVDFVRVTPRLSGGAARREAVRRRLSADVEVREEERLVLDDRSAEAGAALPVVEQSRPSSCRWRTSTQSGRRGFHCGCRNTRCR